VSQKLQTTNNKRVRKYHLKRCRSQEKKKNQYLTGFALETENEFENAKNKLQNKNLDLVVLNSMKNSGAGFEVSTNQVTMISRKGKVVEFPLKEKWEIANDITDFIYNEFE